MKMYERVFATPADRDAWVTEASVAGGVMAGRRAMQSPGCYRLRGQRQAGICLDTVTLFLTDADTPPEGFQPVEQP